jgi:AraC-like DNA-binding protein
VLLSRFLPRLWVEAQSGVDERTHQHLTAAFMHLLANAVSGTVSSGTERARTPEAQRLVLKEFIELHLCDPDLSPGKVAHAGRITTRYLHYLFQGEGESVAQYILRRRLEECAVVLKDVGQRGRTITAVATDYGFRSETQFGRAFRRVFGMSPREYRGAGECAAGNAACSKGNL